MTFDWVSWGAWGLGLLVFLIWIVQTSREFRDIFKDKGLSSAGRPPEAEGNRNI